MSYLPPPGDSVEIELPHLAYVPSPGDSLTISLAGHAEGTGVAGVFISATAVGLHGVMGSGRAAMQVSSIGGGDITPTGEGGYVFADSLWSGSGYVATFGAGAAQVRLIKSAAGISGPIGVGGARVISAAGTGTGADVEGVGGVEIPLTSTATGWTAVAAAATNGDAVARVSVAGAGTGASAAMVAGAGLVRCVGRGAGARGGLANGDSFISFIVSGTGGRGVAGHGGAQVALKAFGAFGAGVSGRGYAAQLVRAAGAGYVIPAVFGDGYAPVQFNVRGAGKRLLEYDEYDAIFIRSTEKQIYVVAQ